jgi:hypothetical protein
MSKVYVRKVIDDLKRFDKYDEIYFEYFDGEKNKRVKADSFLTSKCSGKVCLFVVGNYMTQ